MKRLLLLAAVVAVACFAGLEGGFVPPRPAEIARAAADGDRALAEAFEHRRSHVQVQGSGQVVRVLADDNDGSRHQRFIVRLSSGQTLLIAHNIDLAGRIASLSVGDSIEFSGEYEWNAQGGVVHWTHRDPRGVHVSGWIRHDGHTYE